jgi:hypothetical protein
MDLFYLEFDTLKPQYNDPFNKKILVIKNLILSTSVVNFKVKSPCNNKIPAIKHKIPAIKNQIPAIKNKIPDINNKIFGLFRFV